LPELSEAENQQRFGVGAREKGHGHNYVLQSSAQSLTPNLSLLTEREQEILTLMATGKTDQEISDRLYIAPGTVRVHIHAIVNKLGVRDRAQAVALLNKPN
jgi:two-component system NarL family response regulator